MKKLLLLLLLVAGGVSTVSATEYTVIVKPNSNWASNQAWFALYMENSSGTGTKVAMTETSTGSGYYKGTYNSTYDKKIQIVRMGPSMTTDDNGWNWSANLACPTSDVFYDFSSSSTTSDSNEGWQNLYIAPQTLYSNWVLAANRHIADSYDNWDGTSINNTMTTTDGINYTKTVSSRAIKTGWYGFKFVGDAWYGNPDDSGNNYYVEIASDDKYDITYTFNRITKRGTAVATPKSGSPVIEYKYYVYDNDAASWDGITAFTGKNWSECEMTNVDGTYVYTIFGKELTSGNRYGSRFVEKVYVDGSDVATSYLGVGDSDGGSQGCRYFDCTSNGTYNVVFSFKPSDSNYDLTSDQPKLSVSSGLYVMNSSNWAESGVAMTFDSENGVYKAKLSDINNKYFALAPTNGLSGDDWNNAIRPEYGTSGSYDINSFVIFSGTAVTSGSKTWYLNGAGIDNVEISYRPVDNHWEVQPYRTATITAAGYATWSNGEKCTVSGAEAIYVVDADNTSTVHLTEKDASTVWPENEGMILKGSNGDVITINAVAYGTSASTIGTNYLVGSGNSSTTPATGANYYVFSWDEINPATVGFYKAEGGTLGAHKAYLNLGRDSFNAREFLGFTFDDNEATGISNLTPVFNEGAVYDMQGRKVAQPTKGLYIINGKKVVIK